MKKGTVIASSVFDFIFAACLIAGAAVLFKLFFDGWFDYLKIIEETAILFIIFFVFYILGAAVVCAMFVGGLACIGLSIYYIFAGIKKLKHVQLSNYNKVSVYSLLGLVFASFACTSTVLAAIRALMKLEFDLITIVCIVIFIVSAINIALNAVTYADAKVATKNKNLTQSS